MQECSDAAKTATASTATSRYAVARARLGSAQKSTKSVPAYLRYVNRKAGGRLAAAAYALDLTPSQVTGLSLLSSVAGITVLVVGRAVVVVGIVVTVLMLLGYALDSADGQLARVRGGGTKSGEWLDHVTDAAKLSFLHCAVLISIVRYFDVSRLVIALPVVFLIANVTQFFGMMMRDALLPPPPKAGGAEPRRAGAGLGKSLLLLPLDHGTLGLAFLTLGWHPVFLTCYGFLAACTALFAGHSLTKAYQTLKQYDTAAKAA
ncbi:MAG TPA: CDP-alcohol phosphatidyltransferase family protein [Jatrophihabitans sp.]|nr:CDP-alcohol phosphatidyltransferase family protein [Jatrophihabitans sp.]